jgi:hypothetical protein
LTLRFVLAGQPDPENVTVVTPAWPELGVISAEGTNTVNVAVALVPPAVAWTVCAPTPEDGTTNVTPAGIAPEAPVVGLAGESCSGLPSYVAVIEVFAGKCVPERVTVVPTSPEVGLSEIVASETTTVPVVIADVNVCSAAVTV